MSDCIEANSGTSRWPVPTTSGTQNATAAPRPAPAASTASTSHHPCAGDKKWRELAARAGERARQGAHPRERDAQHRQRRPAEVVERRPGAERVVARGQARERRVAAARVGREAARQLRRHRAAQLRQRARVVLAQRAAQPGFAGKPLQAREHEDCAKPHQQHQHALGFRQRRGRRLRHDAQAREACKAGASARSALTALGL